MMMYMIFSAVTDLDLHALPHSSTDGTGIRTALSIIIATTAALSLLFITIGGFRYVLSQGDPQGISKAKGTIVYALVGLVVAILAQAIVVVVLNGLA